MCGDFTFPSIDWEILIAQAYIVTVFNLNYYILLRIGPELSIPLLQTFQNCSIILLATLIMGIQLIYYRLFFLKPLIQSYNIN